MPEEKERPRPHGDPLKAGHPERTEDNPAQQQSDAPSDILTDAVPAQDEDEEKRKKQYRDGATLVSRID